MSTDRPEGSEVERDAKREDDKPKQAGKEWHGAPPVRVGNDRDNDGDIRPGGDTSGMPAKKQ